MDLKPSVYLWTVNYGQYNPSVSVMKTNKSSQLFLLKILHLHGWKTTPSFWEKNALCWEPKRRSCTVCIAEHERSVHPQSVQMLLHSSWKWMTVTWGVTSINPRYGLVANTTENPQINGTLGLEGHVVTSWQSCPWTFHSQRDAHDVVLLASPMIIFFRGWQARGSLSSNIWWAHSYTNQK